MPSLVFKSHFEVHQVPFYLSFSVVLLRSQVLNIRTMLWFYMYLNKEKKDIYLTIVKHYLSLKYVRIAFLMVFEDVYDTDRPFVTGPLPYTTF